MDKNYFDLKLYLFFIVSTSILSFIMTQIIAENGVLIEFILIGTVLFWPFNLYYYKTYTRFILNLPNSKISKGLVYSSLFSLLLLLILGIVNFILVNKSHSIS